LIGGEFCSADTIAMRLLSHFGSIGGVLSAKSEALAQFIDDPELVKRITVAKLVVMEGLGEQVRRATFELKDVSVQQWIVGIFKGLRLERIHLALLDSQKRLIADEPLSEGNLVGVKGNLRKIVSCGINVDATSIVIMHNHPSGDPRPSRADIEETRRIASLLQNLDLRLEDHLIVSGNAIFSMRGAMLI
jgi:DNA repair protein RadC